jgi:hypothetical protein
MLQLACGALLLLSGVHTSPIASFRCRAVSRHTEAPFDLNNVRSKLESSTYAGLGPGLQKSHS